MDIVLRYLPAVATQAQMPSSPTLFPACDPRGQRLQLRTVLQMRTRRLCSSVYDPPQQKQNIPRRKKIVCISAFCHHTSCCCSTRAALFDCSRHTEEPSPSPFTTYITHGVLTSWEMARPVRWRLEHSGMYFCSGSGPMGINENVQVGC